MAYGAISVPKQLGDLPTLSYTLPDKRRLTCFPVTNETRPEGVAEYLLDIFNEELISGKTYPQEEPQSLDSFIGYFFGATCILGLISATPEDPIEDGTEVTVKLEDVRKGRKWEDCIAGVYYVKPNYPGRSSHNCNAGFLIPTTSRGLKVGMTLGKSYLIYGPKLGYRGSVFNLVYKTNGASLAIWDKLGFTRVGVIPAAGRLKTGANGEEEYVDAVVVWKSFV